MNVGTEAVQESPAKVRKIRGQKDTKQVVVIRYIDKSGITKLKQGKPYKFLVNKIIIEIRPQNSSVLKEIKKLEAQLRELKSEV